MAKVYIFAGFMAVLVIVGLAWLIVARFGVAIFRARKREKTVDEQAPSGVGYDPRRRDGDIDRWV